MTATNSNGVSPETKGQIDEFVGEFCYFLERLHMAQVQPAGVAQSTPLNLLIPPDAAASLFMSIRKDFRGRECFGNRRSQSNVAPIAPVAPAVPDAPTAPHKPDPRSRKARADKMMKEAEKTVQRDPAKDRMGADDPEQGGEFMKDGGPSETVDDAKEKLKHDLAMGLLRCVVDKHTGRVSQVPSDIFSLAVNLGLVAKGENGWCITFPAEA